MPTSIQLSSLIHCSTAFGEIYTISAQPFAGDIKVRNTCVDSYQKPTINQTIFPNTKGRFYWSSLRGYYTNSVSGLDLENGFTTQYLLPHNNNYVRVVRSVNSLSLDTYQKVLYEDRKVQNDAYPQIKARKDAEARVEAEAKARKEQEAYDRKVANFRKNLKVGDDATAGMVIEIKGDLIKIQTNDSQCSQRDYRGNCENWIKTPVEKWVKRRELYPAD